VLKRLHLLIDVPNLNRTWLPRSNVSASPNRHDTTKAAKDDALGLRTAKKSQLGLRHVKPDFAQLETLK
jgi:hypothetical protein